MRCSYRGATRPTLRISVRSLDDQYVSMTLLITVVFTDCTDKAFYVHGGPESLGHSRDLPLTQRDTEKKPL